MLDWLSESARTRPDHPYLVTPEAGWSYRRADEHCWRLAAGLHGRGVGPDTRVGLWATNSVETVLMLFAVWRVGGEVVLVNRRLTVDEATGQLATAGVTVLTGSGAPDLGPGWIDPGVLVADSSIPAAKVEGSATALIVFTSGTAGTPKAVRLTHANLAASILASIEAVDHVPEDRWLANLPLFHIGGVMIPLRCAAVGATTLLEPGFDAVRSAEVLATGQASLASLVAQTLESTLAVTDRFEGVRAVLVGGGPVPEDLVQRAVAHGLPALRTYGMTETASQVATERHPGAGLTAVAGAELQVRGGRVEVRGPMVSPGYLGDPDRAPEAWFQTGDRGEVDANGRLTVLGRADAVIITGGENVSPEEVEAVIRSHPGVADVVVVGIPDARWGSMLVAVYEGAAGAGELDRHVRYRLAGFKVPKGWNRVESLPRTSIGKVDRLAATRLASGS
jgi:O-succinylbenzoic acid--CoA ligase